MKSEELHYNTAFFGIVVVVAAIAVYANSLRGDFIWDDVEQIVENPVIMDLRNVPSFFTSDLWRLISNPTIGSYYYRPLFLLSLAVDYGLWGLNPLGYHITNIIMHSLASLLVYLIGRKLFSNNIPAFVGSMLFAVHPIHVESVAWISGRTDPMAALFLLLSFYLYILYKEGSNILLLLFSLVACFLSLLSKEMAITLPFILAAYELSFHEKKTGDAGNSGIKILLTIGCFVLVSASYMYLRATILGEAAGDPSSPSSPLHIRIYTSFGIILDYIRIAAFPINLKVLYNIPLKESFLDWKVLFPLTLLIIIFVATCLTYKKNKALFFTALWFFITIPPVSNLVPLKPTMMAERYMYIPSMGICLLAGLVVYMINMNRLALSNYIRIFIVIILILLSFITIQRNRTWYDETSYFSRSVHDAPENAYAHHNLGEAYRKTGRVDMAIEEWRKAIQLYPNHPEANNSLANIALMQGKYHEAISRYKTALVGRPGNSESHYNMAIALERTGKTEEAIVHYKEFIRTASPKYIDVVEQVESKLILFDRK